MSSQLSRSGNRPANVKAPAHLSPTTPVPKPQPINIAPEFGGKDMLEPTRYGDWEHQGIAWDF